MKASIAEGGHFSGPWKLVGPHFGHWNVRQDPANWDGQGYQHICSLPAMPKDTQYGEWFRATAELIASAPTLLARTEAAEAERDALAERVAALEESLALTIGDESPLPPLAKDVVRGFFAPAGVGS